MDPAQEFRKHAEECRRMARMTRVLEDRAAWNRMAERWLLCAQQVENEAARILDRQRKAATRNAA
jgi:hypothetical protein